MLNSQQIRRALELKNSNITIRDIAKEFDVNPNEISYTLNAYNILSEEFNNKKDDDICKKQIEILKKEYELFEKELQDRESKLIEREAFGKLFIKHIIYKYKLKEKNLEDRYKKKKVALDKKVEDIKEENFTLYYDLQKEIKEKLDTKDEFLKYKYFNKMKYIFFIFLGSFFTVLLLIFIKFFV